MIKKLGEIEAAGIPYSVYEADASGDLEENLGVCQYNHHRILIRDNMSGAARKDVLFHEMQHAVWNESGAKQFLKGAVADGTDLDEVEETLIRVLTPHLIRAIAGLGKLRA